MERFGDLGLGLLDLFEATSRVVYLERAVQLVTQASERFGNARCAWFLTAKQVQAPLGRRIEIFDSLEPSGNAAMVLLLDRLADVANRRDLEEAAGTALRGYSASMRERGLEMAGWLDAALVMGGPSYDVVVCGDAQLAATHGLAASWSSLLAPWVTGVRSACDQSSAELEKAMPATAGKHALAGVPTAYVCTRGTCRLPTSKSAQVRADVLCGWVR